MSLQSEITSQDLIDFSGWFQTYINQVFGSSSVRQAIGEMYENSEYELMDPVMLTQDGFHHILRVKKPTITPNIDGIWSSDMVEDYQDMTVNHNDTLCQSYTLAKLANVLPGDPDPCDIDKHISNQMAIVSFYRDIIKRSGFIDCMGDIFNNVYDVMQFKDKAEREYTLQETAAVWKDFTKRGHPSISLPKGDICERQRYTQRFIQHISDTLDMWEDYGYMWFVGNKIYM